MIRSAEPIIEYDVELYFALVEKKTVFADCRLIVSLPLINTLVNQMHISMDDGDE